MTRKPKPKPRPPRANPFSSKSDEQLDAAYREALGAYVERLEYFATLPASWTASRAREMAADPGSFGITRAELDELCASWLEHIAAAGMLGDLRSERDRRLEKDAEALAVAMIEKHGDKAAAWLLERLVEPREPYPRMVDGESIAGYVGRVEEWKDEAAAMVGYAVASALL